MRSIHRLMIWLVIFQAANACTKRRSIAAGDDPLVRKEKQGASPEQERPEGTVAAPTAPEWKPGSPAAMQGIWASSLFLDQRCTAFYSFVTNGKAEFNLVCVNAEKKQFEREFRRFDLAQMEQSQQVRLTQTASSCPAGDSRAVNSEGAAYQYVMQPPSSTEPLAKLALWERDVSKQVLSLTKADGLMVEGFPGKMGTYLEMPVIDGCFQDGVIGKFQASIAP